MDSAETAAYGRNIWAEQSVVGSMLIDARVVGLVMASLTETDFLLEADRRLFRAFQTRFAKDQTLDPVVVCQDAGPGDETLRAYTLQLMDSTPTAANVEEYIELVRGNTRMVKSHRIGDVGEYDIERRNHCCLYQQQGVV